MRPPAFDAHRILAWVPELGQGLRGTLRLAAQHTGLPIVLVAAIALIVSWHAFRRALRLAVEVAFAVAALIVATRLGWIAW